MSSHGFIWFTKDLLCEYKMYAYVRYSTEKQTAEAQLEELQKYCNNKKIHLPNQNILFEPATSGAVPWRDRAIGREVKGYPPGSTLMVTEISRLGRNMNDALDLVLTLQRGAVTVLEVRTDTRYGNSAEDLMRVTMMAYVAQKERDATSARVKNGMAAAKAKGIHIGRPSKHGLEQHADRIAQMRAEGIGAPAIAKALGVKTHQVSSWFRHLKPV